MIDTANTSAFRNQNQSTDSVATAQRSAVDSRMQSATYAGYALAAIVALVAPLILTDIYELNVLVFAAINAIMATGLAIVVRTGRLSLAQATFGGVGGYLTGILVTQHAWNYWLALPTAAACAAAFGLILGMASLRLRGFYFAIATLTFGQLAYVVLGAWSSVTGGFSGMFGLPHPSPLGFITFDDPRYYYYVMLAVLCIALIVRLLCTSWTRFGRALSLLGEDDILAQAIGVPSTPYRLSAFAISSAIGGIGGSFNAHFIQGISPPDIAPAVSVFVVVMVMAGGVRFLLGPVIGAVILTAIPELLRASAEWSMVVYGVFLVGYVFLFRDGLLSIISSAARSLLKRDGGEAGAAEGRAGPLGEAGAAPGRDPQTHDGPIMECANVGCAFGSNVVLRSVSLKVNPGTIHGLIGPNGAGKTTLFNVITGNAPLTNGEVRVKGTSVTPRPSIMSRLGLSRTFQNARVFLDRTGRDNVALAAEMSGHDVDPAYLNWVLSACGLRPIENVIVSKLSHFERRLVTIAMAIAARPSLVLLDEPLAGLDDTETHAVQELIHYLHESLGCAVLLIEHKLSVVMKSCQWLSVLDDGEIIAEGVPVEVAKNPAVIEAYLGA